MTTGPMHLLPAVDIKAGAVFQNIDSDRKVSEFFGSPAEVITSFVNFGSKWIHLVDLDTAYGTGENSQLINNLVGSYQVNFQVSGGISNSFTLERALKSKAKWINLSTACLMDVTGTRDSVSGNARSLVERIRKVSNTPVAVGLGVSTKEQASEVAKYADGVIVGSAFIKIIQEFGAGRTGLKKVKQLAKSLSEGVRNVK